MKFTSCSFASDCQKKRTEKTKRKHFTNKEKVTKGYTYTSLILNVAPFTNFPELEYL